MPGPDHLNKPKPVKSKIVRLEDRPTALGTTPVSGGQNQYGPLREQWLAQQAAEGYRAPELIFGDGRVYTGVTTNDFISGRGRYSEAVYEDAAGAGWRGWNAITNDPNAYSALEQIYNSHYRKPANYKPSPNSLQSFYESAVREASQAYYNENEITISDVLNSKAMYDVYGNPVYGAGRGGGGAGSGPNKFVTKRNEADVRILADALAQEMIGRTVTEKEFGRMMKRVRRAENDSPRVVSVNGDTQVTEEGVSDAQRQEVLQEILREKPEWQEYQMTAGVLDAMNSAIQETGALDSGI